MSAYQQGRVPILLLREGATETKGNDARKNNITAAKLIAQVIRSSLGPRGMDKMLVGSTGDVTITNGEMAVVIGKKCKNISESDAVLSICGYMVMNDVSARDIQYTDIQVSRSKCFDTFAPCGPWITTNAEVKDPNDLRVVTKVNASRFGYFKHGPKS